MSVLCGSSWGYWSFSSHESRVWDKDVFHCTDCKVHKDVVIVILGYINKVDLFVIIFMICLFVGLNKDNID